MAGTNVCNVQAIPDAILNGTGYKNGIGLGQLTQTGSQLNGRTKKVVAVRNRFSDVNTNSHSKLLLACQIEGFKRLLDGAGALHGGSRVGEGRHDAVASVLHHTTTLVLQCAANQRVMCPNHLHRSGIAKTLCHAGRANDVGEHDGPQGRIDGDVVCLAARFRIRHSTQKRLHG